MALPSSRVPDSSGSSVNPDRGIYVDSYGIMEVRTASEDIDFEDRPIDMLDFQESTQTIPDDFCHKNRSTTEQKFFFCQVCNCDLKNLKPLRDHVKGNKHIRKACEKKREIMGLPKDPQNAPRKKDIKKERPRVDVGMTLQHRLEGCGEPAIGLEYITEFSNPRDRKDHRMYTCKLQGCKSAWGTSDDIYNHVKNHKHQKNFFKKMFPDDLRINGWTKDTLLTEAAKYEEDEGGADERDYGVINMVNDYEEYMELRNRPDNWSEKKAQMGIVGDRMNSNLEPLGKSRKRRTSEAVEDSMFDEQSWAGWQPPTLSQCKENLEADFARGIMDVKDMVEDFTGQKDDEKYKDIQFYQDTYKSLLSFLGPGANIGLENKVHQWNDELASINNNLVEKVEAEDRAMKEVQAVTLPPIGWSVVGDDQWAGMKTISWAWTKGLAKSPMVFNGLVMGVLDRASRGSMVNEQLKLSTEFVSFSCMGKKKVTCQLPAGCKWYIFRSNWQLISEILPLICLRKF